MAPKISQLTEKDIEGKSLLELGHFLGEDNHYETAEDLLKACSLYFKWVEKNPFYVDRCFGGSKGTVNGKERKMRPLTIEGLCTFIGVSYRTFNDWERPGSKAHNPLLSPVVTRVKLFIREQKLAGAAAGVFNAMIIARDLHLRDSREITGEEGGPITVIDATMTTEEKADAFRDLIQGSKGAGQ